MAQAATAEANIFFAWLLQRVSEKQIGMFRVTYSDLSRYIAEHGLANTEPVLITRTSDLEHILAAAIADSGAQWAGSAFQRAKLQALIIHLINFENEIRPGDKHQAPEKDAAVPEPEPEEQPESWSDSFRSWLSGRVADELIPVMMLGCEELDECLSSSGIALLTSHITEAKKIELEIAQRVMDGSPLIHAKYGKEKLYRMQTVLKLLMKRLEEQHF